MTGYLEILRATGGSDADIATAESFRAEIQPPETGSLGQMLEWSSEFREEHPGHRHFTPFIGCPSRFLGIATAEYHCC